MALGRHREALADGRKAVELRPAWAKGYARVGAAFFALEQYTEVCCLPPLTYCIRMVHRCEADRTPCPAYAKVYARVGAAFFALEQFTEVQRCSLP